MRGARSALAKAQLNRRSWVWSWRLRPAMKRGSPDRACTDTAFSTSRDRFEQVCSFLGDQEAAA